MNELAPRRSYLLRPSDISLGWVALYAVTFAIAWACVTVRVLIIGVIGSLLLWIAGYHQPPGYVYPLIAVAPLAFSLATLVLPWGGYLWQAREGGRRPSQREKQLYEEALTSLRQVDPRLRAPRRWFVLDVGYANAAVYADTLMVTRGMLDSGWLEPVLAHELGHLNTHDGRHTAALARLACPALKPNRSVVGLIAFVASGSLALWITGAAWANYHRQREYTADAYAARLGQAHALAEFLQTNALIYDLPIPYPWIATNSHPPVEHRIERLHAINDFNEGAG